MRDAARSVSADVIDTTPGGTHQARLERDVRVHVTERRLAALQVGEAGLVFGRTDAVDGDRRYIGRLAISDEDNEPLVVDWRAPAAEPFYRATPGAPMGLVRRRHFILRGRHVTGLDDELLTAEPTGDDLVLVGEGALLAALERSRSGRMADIVATIQREQDEIVRSPLSGIVVVQGGPGTGKTAVALHRAAYLLYTFRFPLERAGVLLIGPSRIFLRYIEQVLPALGEHTVNLATPADLVPTPVRGIDRPEVALLKGDARLAKVVAQAVGDRERGLPEPVALLWNSQRLRLSVRDSRRIVEGVKRRRATHNERRAQLERSVVRHLMGQLVLEEADDTQEARETIGRALRADRTVVTALERMWPVLTPEELVHDLFGWPALIRLAGRGVLDESDTALLHRPRSERVADVAWTEADLPLLDEARVHLGPVPRRRRVGGREVDGPVELGAGEGGDGDGRARRPDAPRRPPPPGGPRPSEQQRRGGGRRAVEPHVRPRGHRRGPGPVAHAAADGGPAGAQRVAHHRGRPGPGQRLVGPRLVGRGGLPPALPRPPAAAAGRAHRQLPDPLRGHGRGRPGPGRGRTRAHAVTLRAPGGGGAACSPRSPPGMPTALDAAIVEAARSEQEAVPDGKVAVLTSPSMLDRVRSVLSSAGKGPEMLDAPLAVLPVQQAKGLEFDSVIVVEPAAIVAEHPHGWRALYLALTRTTRRLQVVSALSLPEGLEPSPLSAPGEAMSVENGPPPVP